MAPFEVLIAICWLAFIAYWAISAFSTKRTLHRPMQQLWWIRGAVILVAFFVVRYLAATGDTRLLSAMPTVSPLLASIGVALCAAGVALAIWARVYLGSNWGMPMSVKENPQLVTTGPYRYIRHPIYSGVMLAALGSSLVNPWWLIVFIVSSVYFAISAFAEDRQMQAQFPAEYPAYKKGTCMLIPFIF